MSTTTGSPTAKDPNAKPADPAAKPAEVLTGPEPKEPTPLDPAEIYYNKKWRVPPIIVTTQEQKDALDLNEWTLDPSNPAIPPAKDTKDEWPKLYYDSNIPLKLIGSEDEAAGLDGRWRALDLSEAVIKAALAKLDADAKDAKEKDKPAKPAADAHKPQSHTDAPKK